MEKMLNCDANEKFVKEGLTFDDVLLIPARSEIEPKDVYKRQPFGCPCKYCSLNDL